MTHGPPLSLPPVPDLGAELAALLAQIPRGCVATYGDLAEALGDRAAARWVGEYLVDHSHSPGCPCHRVVLRTGEPGNYIAGGGAEKLKRLAREGVPAVDGAVDLDQHGFRQFDGPQPLAVLMEFQNELPDYVTLTPLAAWPERVIAVDAAYGSSGMGVGALSVTDTATGELLHSAAVQRPVRFPYITGYLAFREIELLRAVLAEAARLFDLPEVVFVDGNGRLHPRRAGIATQFGVLEDRPTIGIGKKLICGSVQLDGLKANESRPIEHAGEIVGAAVVATDSSSPVFVSPGNRVTLDDSVRLTQALFLGHRLPEPIFHADRLSKVSARS